MAVYVGSTWSVSPGGVAASADFMASARSGMTGPTGRSAYLSRTAMSSALIPLTVKGAASVLPSSLASASISKSTSQSHETSRPSASLSFMAIRTLRASAPVTKVRRISLNPTGFFMSSRKASVPSLYSLDPPESPTELPEAAGDLRQPDPCLPGHRGSGEGVVDVVETGEPYSHVSLALRGRELEL